MSRRLPRTEAELEEVQGQKRRRRNVIAAVPSKVGVKTGNRNTTSWEMYIPDPNQETDESAISLNVGKILDATNGIQVCALAVGILCSINNKFVDVLPRMAKSVGVCVETVRLPSQAATYGIEMEDIVKVDPMACLPLFGYTILLIFKNVTSDNYDHFRNARMNALRAVAGVPSETKILNPYSLEKAQAIRAVLGSSAALKARIVNTIIAMSDGLRPIHCVFRYVSSILEYNEMSAVMFPYETLVLPSSPVLTDPRLLNESNNLAEALTLINQSTHPQFFRYLADQDKVSKIARARFPTLAAIGEKLKQEYMGRSFVKNVVGNKILAKGELVDEMVAKHHRFVEESRSHPSAIAAVIRNKCREIIRNMSRPRGLYLTRSDQSDDDLEDEEEDFQE